MIRRFYTLSINGPGRPALGPARKFSTDANVLKHEEFLKNFEATTQISDLAGGSSYTVESIKDKSRGQRERFGSYPLPEGDMYSGKPVWQQLNEIENTWKLKFRYRSRVEAQKKIAKAKKGTETLGELESKASRLVEIDCFRPVQAPQVDAVPAAVEPLAQSLPFETTRDEGVHLVNDINLLGDAYYEKPDLGKELDKAALPDSIRPGNLLAQKDNDLVTEIFGRGDPSYVDATTASSVIQATTNLEPETWINMDPNHILIQQDILKSKSTTQVLAAIGDKLGQMNAVNVATAIHRLAKYTNPYNRFTVCNHETFGKLIAHAESHLAQLDPQGLTNIFWSLTRLRITPHWLDTLLDNLNKHGNSLNVSELANCLFCLSKLTRANEASLELRFKVLSLVQDKITQFQRPLDLTCVSTALARLNVRNPVLFGHISSQVIAALEEFKIQEICGVAWSYASLGFTDHLLFSKIKQYIESNADASNIGNMVHLAWALSKIKEADPDFFLYTISPLVRSHLASLNCRHITTLAWAYVNAGIEDEDLFNDLATTLLQHVDEMTTHDIASSVVAFSHFESHKILLKKIKARAGLMLNEFTPLQLAKIAAGFAEIGDETFYNQLAKVVDAKLHLMSPENIVEILSGFSSATVLPPTLFTRLLNTVARSCKKMYAEDSLILLQLLEKLQGSKASLQSPNLLSNLAENLIEQIDQRVSRWRCFDVTQITTLFNCLKLGPANSTIMNTLVKQLVSCLNRVYKSALAPERKRGIFVNFLLSTNQLPPNSLNVLKVYLAKDAQLIRSFHNFLTLLRADVQTPESAAEIVDVLHACTTLGFSDHLTSSLFDQLVEHEEEFDLQADLERLSKLLWSLVESNLHLKWALEKVHELSKRDFSPSQTDLDALVRLMWSCTVLSEDGLLLELCKHLTKFVDLFPSEVLHAQQVALHLLKCTSNTQVIFKGQLLEPSESPNPSLGVSDSHSAPPPDQDQLNLLREWLDYQREDLYHKNPRSKRSRALEMDHDSLISDSLVKMKIPHKTLHIVENIYRISVSFPVENQLLDVVGFTDVLMPQGQLRASTLLRQRQLQMLGYGLHPLRLASLYEALNPEREKTIIAETISSFNPIAKEHISFSKLEVADESV